MDFRSLLARKNLFRLGGGVEFFEIEFYAVHDGLHDAVDLGGVFGADEFDDVAGNDLPEEAEFVLEPAAGDRFTAAGGEFFPVAIEFGLGVAVDKEGDGFVEFGLGSAIHGDEVLAVEGEGNGHDGTGGSVVVFGDGWGRVGGQGDFGVFEGGGVEFDGLLGVAVEPEEGGNFLHSSTFRG